MYTMYDSPTSSLYYDNTNGKIVLYDKRSGSVGLGINATYIVIIITVAFLLYSFKEWYN